MIPRIYICHTYYHVYVTFLKELNLPKENRGKADLVLSRLSTDFENLKRRVEQTGLFRKVIEFDEKRDDFFPELKKYREDKGNIVFNMLSRIRFTRKYAKLEEAYIPVDFKNYEDIYVYCDSDPVGYYLNQKKIRYHALEDGYPCPQYVEVPRQPLADALTEEDKELILTAFLRNRKELVRQLKESAQVKDKILILTEPLCALDVRERIFRDIIKKYEPEGTIFIKPHPRDVLSYETLFSQYPLIDAAVPMEILNFFEVRFKKVISVFTEMKAVRFADEIIALGADFMDQYEEPAIHRQNERIDQEA